MANDIVPIEGKALAKYLRDLEPKATEVKTHLHPMVRLIQRATGFNRAVPGVPGGTLDGSLMVEHQDNPAGGASERYPLTKRNESATTAYRGGGDEWLLEVRLATAYLKNGARDHESRMHAENVLTYALYGDIIKDLESLWRFVASADRDHEEILFRVSEILSKVKPGHMPGMDCI